MLTVFRLQIVFEFKYQHICGKKWFETLEFRSVELKNYTIITF